ncbi:MAG: major capsid protein [Methylococcales bacterium]|nr:major capsid protein [Methylococcales bacterium]
MFKSVTSVVISALALFGLAESANAALSTDVTTAISTAATDGATLGGLILAVLIGIAAFKWLRGAK